MKNICSKCGKPASIHYKKTVNGKSVEYFLCTECAESGKYIKKEEFAPLFSNDIGDIAGAGFFSDSFFSPFSIFGDIFPQSFALPEDEKCPLCQKSVSEIKKDGIFGCGECYSRFAEKSGLSKIMPAPYKGGRSNAGNIKKSGEKPQESREDKIKRLRAELKNAVEKENYERAAVLRDEIRGLEA